MAQPFVRPHSSASMDRLPFRATKRQMKKQVNAAKILDFVQFISQIHVLRSLEWIHFTNKCNHVLHLSSVWKTDAWNVVQQNLNYLNDLAQAIIHKEGLRNMRERKYYQIWVPCTSMFNDYFAAQLEEQPHFLLEYSLDHVETVKQEMLSLLHVQSSLDVATAFNTGLLYLLNSALAAHLQPMQFFAEFSLQALHYMQDTLLEQYHAQAALLKRRKDTPAHVLDALALHHSIMIRALEKDMNSLEELHIHDKHSDKQLLASYHSIVANGTKEKQLQMPPLQKRFSQSLSLFETSNTKKQVQQNQIKTVPLLSKQKQMELNKIYSRPQTVIANRVLKPYK